MLKMKLKVMEDLIKKKKSGEWDWDYVINLSESDFPVKSVHEFTIYLSSYQNDENLIGFRGHNYPIKK